MSVEAVHERLIWEDDCAVAVRLPGVDGGVESAITVKPLINGYPLGYPTQTSHTPSAVPGIEQLPLINKVALLKLKEHVITEVPCLSVTSYPVAKFSPVIVIPETVVPAIPDDGVIDKTFGALAVPAHPTIRKLVGISKGLALQVYLILEFDDNQHSGVPKSWHL